MPTRNSRTILQNGQSFFPSGAAGLTNLPKDFFSSLDPKTVTGTILLPGDRWLSTVVTSNRPLGSANLVAPIAMSASATSNTVLPGFTLTYEDQFTTVDSSRWSVYNNSTFGAPDRIQTYMAANAVTGQASAGATNGNSLFYPRYGRFEWRVKIPHGQGLWPALWITASLGGATTCEFDIVEYFHSQLPSKNSSTIHGTDNTGTFHANRYTNNGAAGNGVGGRTFFEAPTYTPGWHTWAADILPVTDSTGNTIGDPTQPSGNVLFIVYLDGTQVWRVVDTSALWWTTNGGTTDSFWNIYLQGCQIDGKFVGHPEDTLGYSHENNICLISGTPPNCTITTGGFTVQRAQFNDPASTVEIDYFKNWKYTG
jgi:hypothetical protein